MGDSMEVYNDGWMYELQEKDKMTEDGPIIAQIKEQFKAKHVILM